MNPKLEETNIEKKITLPVIVSLMLIIVFSFLITGAMFFLQNNGVLDLKFIFEKSNYVIFWLNYIPVLLFLLLIYFLTNNTVFSVSVVSLLMLTAAVVNRFKIKLRQDPLLPWDFTLFKEVLSIAKSTFKPIYFVMGLLIIFLIIVIVLAMMTYIKSKKMNSFFRVISFTSLLILTMYLNKNIYYDTELFSSFHVMGNVYNQVEVFESKGFLYSFIYTMNHNSFKKFDGYDKNIIAEKIDSSVTNDFEKFKDVKKPNIIVIMSEGFSEVGERDGIDYKGFNDPLKNFKEIREDSAIYGHIVTPNVGGGTGDTEFDVLTGVNSRLFRGVPFAYRLITKNIYALPTILGNLGYENIAIHPGHKWFYNRQNVYKFMGFSDLIGIEEFPLEQYKGMYVDETSTFNRIISEFEKNTTADNHAPFFEFVVTIQNHGPYFDKYLSETNFNTTLPLSKEDINAMSNYFEGLSDSDRELKRLCDYLENYNEPTILVYFGDHLPGFTKSTYENIISYDDTELSKLTEIYKTPFIVWENKASKESINVKSKLENISLPNRKLISSNYLEYIILEAAGFQNIDSYVNLSGEMMENYPVILEESYFDKNYNLEKIPDEKIKEYKYWQYYKIFDEEK